MPREPYCRNCKYVLTGLTESSKCPECGKPLVDVLERGPMAMGGRRYRSSIELFGLPLLDVAYGPYDDQRIGRARGIIAMGDIATGVLAMGGIARGFVAIGGLALGIISLGGMSVGLLVALGGLAFGGLANGGMAVGGVAHGGMAAGYIAHGGLAIGQYAFGGLGVGTHVIDGQRTDPAAQEVFRIIGAILGAKPGSGPYYLLAVAAGSLLAAFLAVLPVALVLFLAYLRVQRSTGPP